MKLKDLLEDIELKGGINYQRLIRHPINLTDTLNVDGDVDLAGDLKEEIPWKFGIVKGSFSCAVNEQLETLKNCPTKCAEFFCQHTGIESLEYCPTHMTKLFASYCKIKSLVNIHKHITYCNQINLTDNPIEEGGLGLLLINGLREINSNHPAKKIIAKYIGQGKSGIIACQKELIENGYEKFAKL